LIDKEQSFIIHLVITEVHAVVIYNRTKYFTFVYIKYLSVRISVYVYDVFLAVFGLHMNYEYSAKLLQVTTVSELKYIEEVSGVTSMHAL